jgi:hypothetical protein
MTGLRGLVIKKRFTKERIVGFLREAWAGGQVSARRQAPLPLQSPGSNHPERVAVTGIFDSLARRTESP